MTIKKFNAPKLKELAIEIGDVPYVLREMTGALRDSHQTFLTNNTRFDTTGKPIGFRTMEGVQSGLISKCLFDKDGQPVERKTIDAWPATLVDALYEECRKLNGMLSEKEEKAAGKNDSAENVSAGSDSLPS